MSEVQSSWQLGVCSEVNEEYVSNPYPNSCECVEISVRIPLGAPVSEVWLRALCDGLNFRVKMGILKAGRRFVYYHTDIEMCYHVLQYRFELNTPDGFVYYTSAGCTPVVPLEDTNFVILSNLRVPKWVPGSVFYQIFPDRFRKGDPSIGVTDDEYQFDGASSVALEWGDDPLEFDDGRCLDFYNGDLAGIQESISHFQELSVDAIYLNPIFRARTNHRYDCVDYFHVDEHLGGDDALVSLSERLHEKGLRLILDISINHTGVEHVWFEKASSDSNSAEAGFYMRRCDGTYVCWWDVPSLVELNYSSQRLRDVMWRSTDSVLKHYLNTPFSIDGWRFDVANEVGRHGERQFCHEIWREVRSSLKHEYPGCYLLGEHWEDTGAYLRGDQWDAAMNYIGSARPIRSWLGELDRFLMDTWGHDPKETNVHTARQLAQSIEQHLRRLPNQLMFQQYNLIDSHDTPRLHHHAEIFDVKTYTGALMLLFTLPGAVSYFYGDEIGISGHAGSMEGARFPMQWDRSSWNMEIFELYRDLGKLRKKYRKLFGYGTFRILHAEQRLFVCARQLYDEAVITVISAFKHPEHALIDLAPLGGTSAVREIGTLDVAVTDRKLSLDLAPGDAGVLLCRCEW
jgi:alpha-glucosidase